jgi:hypothetical protein
VSLSTAIGSPSERANARQERDQERGYAINTKQVLLAFAVEFFIIGLILFAQYEIAKQQAGQDKIFTVLLFPIALAVVELARVPLAIAVRTQNSWSVKLFAALGVSAAVVVTSFSLSTIAYQTFDPRLAVVNEKSNGLHELRARKNNLSREIAGANDILQQKIKDRDALSARYNQLQLQISQLKTAQGEFCTTSTNSEGVETKKCQPYSSVSPAQIKTLNTQLAEAQKELAEKEGLLRQAEIARASLDTRAIDEKIVAAEREYRIAVNDSQLHSYTSMILRKDPTELTDGEIKALESYLIFIPSIAAALASTLLAITAVRRIKSKREAVADIPSDAATYLFGPLIEAIKKQADTAIAAALASQMKPAPPANEASRE